MLLPEELDIEATLFSGQTFAWRRAADGLAGCADGRAAYLDTESRTLLVEEGTEAFWRRYFNLGCDYGPIFKKLAGDAYVSRAFAAYGGMRILNQPVWETLCAFIVSANNNIKRIGGIIGRLCAMMGEPRRAGPETVYTFPGPEAILREGEAALYALGLGYRAPYLYGTAKAVAEGFDLSALPRTGYENAVRALTRLPGVGEKVADCVLLFSCGYSMAFPVDVWVRRVMRVLYGAEGPSAKVKAKGRALFGEDAGVVQQILFHAARMGVFPELCRADPALCDSPSACVPNV